MANQLSAMHYWEKPYSKNLMIPNLALMKLAANEVSLVFNFRINLLIYGVFMSYFGSFKVIGLVTKNRLS